MVPKHSDGNRSDSMTAAIRTQPEVGKSERRSTWCDESHRKRTIYASDVSLGTDRVRYSQLCQDEAVYWGSELGLSELSSASGELRVRGTRMASSSKKPHGVAMYSPS